MWINKREVEKLQKIVDTKAAEFEIHLLREQMDCLRGELNALYKHFDIEMREDSLPTNYRVIRNKK